MSKDEKTVSYNSADQTNFKNKKYKHRMWFFVIAMTLICSLLGGNIQKVSASSITLNGGIISYHDQTKTIYLPTDTDGQSTTIDINGGNITVVGDAERTYTNLAIEIRGGATVTIENVKIDNRSWNGGKAPITAKDTNWSNKLLLSGDNSMLSPGNTNHKPGVDVSNGTALIIDKAGATDDSGKLRAEGGWYAAGIGAAPDGTNGHVSINGGEIEAIGGREAAGIGGGANCQYGTVRIYGGNIFADSDREGAGIGGGRKGIAPIITINGGEIEAWGGGRRNNDSLGGAGIGAGYQCDNREIIINGGTITALSAWQAAGIGSSFFSRPGIIRINGGNITASGRGSQAIGSGSGGHEDGATIIISGGIVDASSNMGYSAIGARTLANYPTHVENTSVTIMGGKIVARGGPRTNFSGDNDRMDSINAGSIIISGGSLNGNKAPTDATDSSGIPLYLTTVTIDTPISGMNIPVIYSNDVSGTIMPTHTYLDEDKKLYLWLHETVEGEEKKLLFYDGDQLYKAVGSVTNNHNSQMIATLFTPSIQLYAPPTKTLYSYGEDLDFSGARIQVNYGNSSEMTEYTYDITLTPEMLQYFHTDQQKVIISYGGFTEELIISGYDNTQIGEQRVTVSSEKGHNLEFDVTVTAEGSTISPNIADFDKNPTEQLDIETTITWNDGTAITEIKRNGEAIGLENYSVDNNILTIYKAYLAAQATGSLELTIGFDVGNEETLTINIEDTTTYTIEDIASQIMAPLKEGYSSGTQETKTIQLNKTGTGDLNNVAVTLSGENATDFSMTPPSVTTLDTAKPKATFNIRAKDGLSTGTYMATITVTADNMNPVAFTVTQEIQERVGGSIIPSVFSYDISNPTNAVTNIIWNDASTVTDVVYGSQSLSLATEYSINVNELTIKEDYISKLNIVKDDSIDFIICFDVGESVFTVDIVDSYIPSSDATLKTLKVLGEVVPNFHPNQYEYMINLPYDPQVVDIIVEGTPNDPRAKRVDVQVGTPPTSVTVYVVAEDDTTKTYTIYFIYHQLSENNNLESLTLSTGTLNPVFSSDIINYQTSVSNSVDTIQITPVKADDNATIKVNNKSLDSGEISQPIQLNVGNNTIKVQVTAEDGTAKIYTIVIIRETAIKPISSNADLKSLSISEGILSPAFNKAKLSYTSTVENQISSIILSAETEDTKAQVEGTGTKTLTVGLNTIEVKVTAEDGITEKVYTIGITRKTASNGGSSGGGSSGRSNRSRLSSVNPTKDTINKEIALTIGKLEARIDHELYLLDAKPFIDEKANRTLVPIRFISEALGAEVVWIPETEQVLIEEGGKEILLTIGSKEVVVNEEIILMDTEPRIMPPGRTFVPLRFVSEILGATVEYDEVTREITIIK